MSSPLEIVAGITVELVFVALAIGLLYRVWGRVFAIPQRRVILPFQKGVLLQATQVVKTLDPGMYWISPKRTLFLCDMRPVPFQVPSIELLTVDKMNVRISLSGEYQITNPASFISQSSDTFAAFYLEVRRAVFTAVGELHSDSFIKEQVLLTDRVKELLVPRSAQLGLEIAQIEVWEAVPLGWVRQI